MKRILAHASGMMALSATSAQHPDDHYLMGVDDRRFSDLETEDLTMEPKQPPTTTTGAQRAEQRAIEKHRKNMQEQQERVKRAAETADVSDVFFASGTGQAVLVKGMRVGYWKEISGKFILFSNAGEEVTTRARQRDLKKMAAGLYVGTGVAAPLSRQVRRRLARKDW